MNDSVLRMILLLCGELMIIKNTDFYKICNKNFIKSKWSITFHT